MLSLLPIIAIYIILILQPLFLISRFKQRFEIALPICMIIDVLIILLAGLVFQRLTIGVVLVVMLATASLAYTAYAERKDYKGFLPKVLTPGFYAFGVCYVFAWATNYARIVTWVDDIRAYAVQPMQMFFHDRLYTDPNVFMPGGTRSPPFQPLFQ